MDELISKQSVIDLWEKYHPTIAVDAMQYDAELRQLPPVQPERLTDKEAEEYQRIIDRFMAFASAQLEPRWIPVEERLPREGQRVLVTDEDGGIDIAHFIDYSDFGEGIEWWVYDYKCNPIAWSELPTAYERSEE